MACARLADWGRKARERAGSPDGDEASNGGGTGGGGSGGAHDGPGGASDAPASAAETSQLAQQVAQLQKDVARLHSGMDILLQRALGQAEGDRFGSRSSSRSIDEMLDAERLHTPITPPEYVPGARRKGRSSKEHVGFFGKFAA